MKHRIANPFKALKSRNFLIYWVGLSISQTGSWMQNIAQPWLALIITDNAALVGLVAAIQFLPILIFSLFSGSIIDRLNKKMILYATQSGLCIVSLLFALSVIFGFATFEIILILAFLTGLFWALDSPCRHSFLYELVDDKNLVPNAVALNSMSVSVSRILGPSLAGIIMAKFGIAMCFLFNTISFIAIFVSLFFINPIPTKLDESKQSLIKSIIEGILYIKKHDILLTPLVILLIIGTFIPNYSVTVSALVKFNLFGSEQDFAYLIALLGVGAFFGALFMAFNSNPSYKIVKIVPFISASSLLFVGFCDNFWSVGVFLTWTAFSFLICLSTINSILQLNSKDEFRGRVMSIFTLFFLGSTPFGAAIAGFLAKSFGADKAFIICAVITYILLMIWWVFKAICKK